MEEYIRNMVETQKSNKRKLCSPPLHPKGTRWTFFWCIISYFIGYMKIQFKKLLACVNTPPKDHGYLFGLCVVLHASAKVEFKSWNPISMNHM